MGEKIPELVYTDIKGIDLTDDEILKCSSALPVYLREKVRASAQKGQRMQRLASGLLLVYLLNRHGMEAACADIGEGPHGKPQLKNAGGLYFNLSHSEDISLAVLAGSEAGCDIQRVKSHSSRIAERFFTPGENELIKEAEEYDRDRIFTRLWARKESYIKALGEGLARDLKSFSVIPDEMPEGFYLADYELEDYAAAVCLRADDGAPAFSVSFPHLRFIPFQNLVNVL